jgi:hypothetical protein
MNVDVSVDNNNHSVLADEICQLPNDMPVNSTSPYKTVYLCSDKPVGANLESPYTIEAPFLTRTPHKSVDIAASQDPAGPNATANDVTTAVEFLLSEQASFNTVVNLPVTAGASF